MTEGNKSDQEKIVYGFEATLFITLLKLRAYNKMADISALKDIEEALRIDDECIEYLVPLLKFVRNIIYFRSEKEEDFKNALFNSKELSDTYGDKHPRYRLQYGYYLMRCYREFNGGQIALKKAIDVTEMVLTQTKNIDKYKTCYCLSLSNLANYYVETKQLDDYERAYNYLNELLDMIDIQNDLIIMFKYTKAHVLFNIFMEKYKSGKIKIDITKESLEKAFNELQTEVDLNKDLIGYSQKRYKNLIREYKKFRTG